MLDHSYYSISVLNFISKFIHTRWRKKRSTQQHQTKSLLHCFSPIFVSSFVLRSENTVLYSFIVFIRRYWSSIVNKFEYTHKGDIEKQSCFFLIFSMYQSFAKFLEEFWWENDLIWKTQWMCAFYFCSLQYFMCALTFIWLGMEYVLTKKENIGENLDTRSNNLFIWNETDKRDQTKHTQKKNQQTQMKCKIYVLKCSILWAKFLLICS